MCVSSTRRPWRADPATQDRTALGGSSTLGTGMSGGGWVKAYLRCPCGYVCGHSGLSENLADPIDQVIALCVFSVWAIVRSGIFVR